ncbi:hypothetical protein JX266_013727 [Neoarthrinium moseri]|nr:hypothetical protein JX266_013727 [Neoarthrinium moseri]
MDLNSMLNSDSGAGGASRRPQPPPPPPLSKPPSASPSMTMTPAPQTPVQQHPHHGFRDYSQSMHASPGQAPGPPPHEYHPGHPPPGPPAQYASPTTQHPPPGAFASRPAPPPIQPPGTSNDPRSPGSAMSGPSPYRHTPTSSLSSASQGYPFPPGPAPGQQPPPSPQQRHQYGPPAGYPRDPRESFASPGGSGPPAVGMPSHHGSVSYGQGPVAQQPMPPQTPPVTTPGGHPYLQQQQQQQQQHQRSQSVQSASTSTPTSGHPHQFGGPTYGPQSGSPVATAHSSLPHFDHRDQRQTSQPPTPLGPPAAPRQSPGNFAQPSSPYQQRMSTSSAAAALPQSPYTTPHPPPPQKHPGLQLQQHQHQQPSPPPPYSTSIPQQTPNSGHYDAVSDSHRRSQSHTSHERDRSVSVSPKTRIPSLTGSLSGAAPGPRPSSVAGSENSDLHYQQGHPAPVVAQMPAVNREGTPAKRKLDDRDLRPDEVDGGSNRRPPPPQLNGNHTASSVSQSASPVAGRRKKIRHAQVPVWAQSGKGHPPNVSRNYVLKSKSHGGAASRPAQVNGHAQQPPAPTVDGAMGIKSEHASRHASPEAARRPEDAYPTIGHDNRAWKLLDGRPFPLEPVCLNAPLDHVAKSIADWLYVNIMHSEHFHQVQSRQIQWEIEAKFGTIIDRQTNHRVHYPVNGECIMTEEANIAFRSSMTLAQHRSYNEWLNALLATTHPRNPNNKPYQHVPISYKHRKEVDHFYELPSALYQRVPAALSSLAQSKQPLKARVTTNQETGDVIAKIIKARIVDLNIHLPMTQFDCRISINLEWDWDGPAEEIVNNHPQHRERQPDRAKDRMSYNQGHFQVDLTQVSQVNTRTGQTEKEHELEVEMDANMLIEQAMRAAEDKTNLYEELIEGFVNNIRGLARKVFTENS